MKKSDGKAPLVVEVPTAAEANELDRQGYRLERYSETRAAYIMIRRTRDQ